MLLFSELFETWTASMRSVKVIRSTPRSASIMPTRALLDRAPADVSCGMLLSSSLNSSQAPAARQAAILCLLQAKSASRLPL